MSFAKRFTAKSLAAPSPPMQDGAIATRRGGAKGHMAKIFVSHNSADKDWANWIGFVLEDLGHEPAIDRWEIGPGGDIGAWMDQKLADADHCLCVCSPNYFGKLYSDWERRSALWVSKTERPGFVFPVLVEKCELPPLMAPILQCRLFEATDEAKAVELLKSYLQPDGRPTSRPAFPARTKGSPPAFPPSRPLGHSNVPLREPEHFLGRDNSLAEIEKNLAKTHGRVVVTALHGLRGVGKSTLAAVYAHKNRRNYRATWWIAAQTESTLRADLAGLGVAMGWIDRDEKEEAAVRTVLERLRDDGAGVLLIFDNANAAEEIRPYLPVSGEAKIIATSNSDDWLGLATPVEIDVWPKETGADFLIERTRRANERDDALTLSEALGGLPLAHEQAGAYCARLKVSFAEYMTRFEAAPVDFLDKEKDAPADYHNRLTVAKSFAIAIEQASKLDPAAAPLIEYAALLAPEPIPLFFFLEGGKELGPPFDTLDAEGLDEAIAALGAFALVDRETIEDERDASIKTETIRLHRLVRTVAAARLRGEAREEAQRALIEAMGAVYPEGVYDDYKCWPRARRLDALALGFVKWSALPKGFEAAALWLFDRLASFRASALGDYGLAHTFFDRALELAEKHLVPDDLEVARISSNLADNLRNLGGEQNLLRAREHASRVLSIVEKRLGTEDHRLAIALSNLAAILTVLGGTDNLDCARTYLNTALAIDEKVSGPASPQVANRLSNLAMALLKLGGVENTLQARKYLVRAAETMEKGSGSAHPHLAIILSNLAQILIELVH